MQTQMPPPSPAAQGFTLIELMVAVLVASILLGIAVPSYLSNVRQSRRTDAKTALLDLAGREERYFNTNNAYTAAAANLGYGTSGNVTNLPVGTTVFYYQVTVNVNPTTPVALPTGYNIIATPIATSDQAKDTTCASFYLDSTGTQTATSSSGTTTTSSCW
jgi:type IV pilus assembly protein PilE